MLDTLAAYRLPVSTAMSRLTAGEAVHPVAQDGAQSSVSPFARQACLAKGVILAFESPVHSVVYAGSASQRPL